jgi:hypothetical protein
VFKRFHTSLSFFIPVKKPLKLKANLYLTGIKGITADSGKNKKIF